MPMKRYKPEQIVTLLRQIEVEIANGKTTPQACRDAQITVQTLSFAKILAGRRIIDLQP
jgi:putative transposase